MPVVAAVFAVLVAAPVLASSTGTSGTADSVAAISAAASGSAASGVRAREWWLDRLDVKQAWQASEGAGVTVAVLSTGVGAKQPDLAGAVSTGPDYTGSGRYSGGPYWGVAGTAAASIIAGHGHGSGDNSGIIGIAPRAKILSLRVTLEYNDPLNAAAAIPARLPTAIADGILYAANHGAKVIDLPLDAGTFGLAGDHAAAGGSTAERAAVRYALAKGVVLVGPAGDRGAAPDQASYPAAYPGVLAVGAADRAGKLTWFSGRDSNASLTAPGVDLMAASMVSSPGNGYVPGYAPITTTSAASAMAAGVAALVVAKYPQLSVDQVVHALRASATSGTEVNAARALSAAAAMAPADSPVPVRTPAPAKPGQSAHVPPAVRKAPGPARASTHAAATGKLTGVVRDAVLAVCALVLLLAMFALAARIRRIRAQKAFEAARSQTPARSTDPASPASQAATRSANPTVRSADPGGRHQRDRRRRSQAGPAAEPPIPGNSLAPGPGTGLPAGTGRPPGATAFPGGSLADRPMSGASLAGGSLGMDPLAVDSLAAGWPPATDWPGRAPGEMSHYPAGPRRPEFTPMPKSGRAKPDAGAANPPWAPAPEPGSGNEAPAPVPPAAWFPSEQVNGIRLPANMPPANLAAANLAAAGLPAADIPAAAREPSGFDGPDLTTPFAGRDVFTQSSFGFAAAPVPTEFVIPTEFTAPAGIPLGMTDEASGFTANGAAGQSLDQPETDQRGDPA